MFEKATKVFSVNQKKIKENYKLLKFVKKFALN